jgi:hypothetical protein
MTLERSFPEPDGVVRIAEPGETTLAEHDGQHHEGDEDDEPAVEQLACHSEHLLPLEAEVLERLGRTPVEHGGAPFVAALGRQVALCDPRGRAM